MATLAVKRASPYRVQISSKEAQRKELDKVPSPETLETIKKNAAEFEKSCMRKPDEVHE